MCVQLFFTEQLANAVHIYIYISIYIYIYGVGTAMAAARRHEGGECFQRGTSCSTESRAAMVAVG
eukprot:COSAG03_NODE_919_length_5330_cov_652.065188_6_plen_65_part_00